MNFIGRSEANGTAVELKYCERCGGIWLRAQGESEVYCAGCRVRMAEMERPVEGRSRKPRLPHPAVEDLRGQVRIEYLQAVTELEVRA
ncbi:MAG TPA: hypothetical protein VGV15_04575 [Terriglobales bacterium]|nr:hypothetical protein [Terriglobales bacterium]